MLAGEIDSKTARESRAKYRNPIYLSDHLVLLENLCLISIVENYGAICRRLCSLARAPPPSRSNDDGAVRFDEIASAKLIAALDRAGRFDDRRDSYLIMSSRFTNLSSVRLH